MINNPINESHKLHIVSQNLTNYNLPIPNDAIFRINLAWCDTIDELKIILEKHKNNDIFLDLPINRIKPPNNKYSIKELIPIIKSHKQIKYLAISNVESASNLKTYVNLFPKTITIVPKIESPQAILNIKEIVSVLKNKKIIMLDHDDLFSAIIKNNEPESKFKEYIAKLITFCNNNNIVLLRTIGVIFSDDEKRVSQYIK